MQTKQINEKQKSTNFRFIVFCIFAPTKTNKEVRTTWYYVNARRNVDSEKIRVPDGIWTHNPPWSSGMLYYWATGDSVVSKDQIVGIDWKRIVRLHSHVLAHMNLLTASRRHIKASHELANSITPSQVTTVTTTWYYVNSRRNVDSEKSESQSFLLEFT